MEKLVRGKMEEANTHVFATHYSQIYPSCLNLKEKYHFWEFREAQWLTLLFSEAAYSLLRTQNGLLLSSSPLQKLIYP